MSNMEREVVRTRRYESRGYEVKDELWTVEGQPPLLMEAQAYNKEDEWIGDSKLAYKLWHDHGIYPQKSAPEHCTCSIGFSEKKQKWYGWSHRAIVGFEIGDKIFEERFGDDKTPFIQHGKETIKTLDDAKVAATRFAGYVS